MITYDFHVHTCLSPDADDSMTPVKVIDRAVANGLDVIAITDHNAVANLPAACEYAYDKIVFLPGIEVESVEEVHVTCLFPDLTSANRMGRVVRENMHIKYNKPQAFGNQYVVDEFDEIIEEESRLLRFSTKMTIEEIFYVARQMRGVAIYAHVNKRVNSVLSVLGTLPARPEPKLLEAINDESGREFAKGMGSKFGKPIVFSSNAHKLDEINNKENSHDLESLGVVQRNYKGELTAQGVIDMLREFEGI